MVLGATARSMAPAYEVEVEKNAVGIGVTQLIESIEYESADGVADMAKISASNIDNVLTDSKIFAVGNEVAIWMGYGSDLNFIGRVIITKVEASYPQQGEPAVNIIGYTKDHQMMDNAPPQAKKFKGKGSQKKNERARKHSGRHFKQSRYSDAVDARAEDYGFKGSADQTPDEPHDFVQKSGLNDYEFVQGLSNLTGFVFWVEGDEAGNWTLYFKDPNNLGGLQEKKYTFKYNTEHATLFSFEPTMTFMGSHTKLIAHAKNAQTGKLLKTELEEDTTGPDTKAKRSQPVEEIIEPPPSAGSVRVFLGDFSFDVVTNKQFSNENELIRWADQWFRRNQENFIMARGQVMGLETLKARQTHAIDGVGITFSGDYYFTRVRHIMSSSAGYICDFNCRRIIELGV